MAVGDASFWFPVRKFDDPIGLHKNFRYLEDFLKRVDLANNAYPTIKIAPKGSDREFEADYVTDGTADEVQIEDAFEALDVTGGTILMLPGSYEVGDFTIPNPTTSSLATVRWLGEGAYIDLQGTIQIGDTSGSSDDFFVEITGLRVRRTTDVTTHMFRGRGATISFHDNYVQNVAGCYSVCGSTGLLDYGRWMISNNFFDTINLRKGGGGFDDAALFMSGNGGSREQQGTFVNNRVTNITDTDESGLSTYIVWSNTEGEVLAVGNYVESVSDMTATWGANVFASHNIVEGVNEAGHHNLDLGDLTDVTITSVADDEMIKYNDGTAVWENVQRFLDAVLPLQYKFSATITATDPTAGYLQFDNATPASVTNLYLDDLNDDGIDVGDFLSAIDSGAAFMLMSAHDKADYLIGTVTSAPTDNTGWWTIPVTLTTSGTLPTADDELILTFVPAGVSELTDLSDVNTSTPTNKNFLIADGVDWESRALVEADISDLQSYLLNIVTDTTPQLGGNLDVNGQSIVSVSAGNITLTPDTTGNIVLGAFTLDADQSVGVGQDNYVLTYDNGTGLISLEAAAGGSVAINDITDVTITTPADNEVLAYDNGTAEWINQTAAEAGLSATGHTHLEADITDLQSYLLNIVEDTTPQLGGALDGQGFDLNNLGVVFLTEQAAAEVDVAGKGQLWVKTATPNQLWFTDDAGTDAQVEFDGHTHLEADVTDLGAYITDVTGSPLDELSDVDAHALTKGQLLVADGDSWNVLAVGADGKVLKALSTEATGLVWGTDNDTGGAGSETLHPFIMMGA